MAGGTRDTSPHRDDLIRRVVVAGADMVCWPLGIGFATLVEEWSLSNPRVLALMAAGFLAQLAFGLVTGLYRRRYQPLSFEEIGAIALSFGFAGVTVLVVDRVLGSAGAFGHRCVLATASAAVLGLLHRYLRRVRARYLATRNARHREPVIVVGAGEGGHRAVKAMLADPTGAYRPVGLLDDDPTKRNLRLMGVRVVGRVDDLPAIARRLHARTVVVAVPTAPTAFLRHVHALATGAGMQTLVQPPVQQWVGTGTVKEFTRYSDEDVLRRNIVHIDVEAVRALVAGRRVLVTGAGGSIGSELSRQVAELDPALLVLLDHDDSLLHAVQSSLTRRGDVLVPELADIRDRERMYEIFQTLRPHVVFHAAALKHVPALEMAPAEGWKTNVLGTANVLHAAEAAGVAHFVNISTDKAAEPVNVLGMTKRVAERLTAEVAGRTAQTYVSVRFGNVIGSRGSAIETFEAQIAAGGPVTVTHPEVTRYFMAVREAVRLTMQAAAIGRPGEVLVLDMGAPVLVADVARRLIAQSGKDVEIVYTGLRPGEKLHEVLLTPGEQPSRPFHPMIDHVTVEPVTVEAGSPYSSRLLQLLAGVAQGDYPRWFAEASFRREATNT